MATLDLDTSGRAPTVGAIVHVRSEAFGVSCGAAMVTDVLPPGEQVVPDEPSLIDAGSIGVMIFKLPDRSDQAMWIWALDLPWLPHTPTSSAWERLLSHFELGASWHWPESDEA